jgi:amino-acid N-acetyltransferase
VLLPCRFSRVLLLDEAGGLSDTAGRLLHFVNARRLQRLLREPDPAAGSGTVAPGLRRRWVLELVHTLLAHGVLAISLCRMADLEQELFTYQGCGTFFSHNHYCTVRRLAWDDLPTAAALVRHGEQEGYLLPRSEADRLEILLSGYGAFLGGTHPAGAQLAGLCGLLTAPYAGERAGEVVTLYTLTRFQGGGIGDHLVREIRRIGRQQGLRSLFACTRDPRVGAFFVRHGFVHVAPDALPAAKWHHYDPARKAGIMALQLTWHETRRPGR